MSLCPSPQRVEGSVLTLERWLRVACWVGVACWLAGCATQEITVITLSGVVRGGEAVPNGLVPSEAMQLGRDGKVYQVSPDMPLQLGDALATGNDTSAVISYPGGARAYLRPNTQVRIGSIIDDLGKVFVKVKGKFAVKTKFVTAGSEGTQYWVDVVRPNLVKVVVVEDVVSLSSNTGAWAAQPLRAHQQALCRGNDPIAMSAADPGEIQREKDWVASMDRMVPVKMTMSPWVPLLVVIGAGAILINDANRDAPPGQAGGQSTGRRLGR